jgi:hypothetical protein
MLIAPDDTLWHQLPTTFDHVGTSDPRFFDRYWFAAYDRTGAGSMQFTLGVYQNMDVVDGGFVAIVDGRQHNIRVSRALRPRYVTACGPLSVEILEPLARARLVIGHGDHPVHGELEWTAIAPPQEEAPRFTRVRGRVVEDSRRFDQIGVCHGRLEVEGETLEIDDWWACRDHSWGVRERMGIPEPITGPPATPSDGSLFAFLFFSTAGLAGHVQIAQRTGHPDYFTAQVADRLRPQEPPLEATGAELRLELFDDRRPRRFRTATLTVHLEDGRTLTIDCTALGSAIAMPGLGYGGYDDGLGLGVWRGPEHIEHDTWDVSHPTEVVHQDGTVTRPVHRIQPVRVVIGDDEGTGSLTMIAEGSLPRHGL